MQDRPDWMPSQGKDLKEASHELETFAAYMENRSEISEPSTAPRQPGITGGIRGSRRSWCRLRQPARMPTGPGQFVQSRHQLYAVLGWATTGDLFAVAKEWNRRKSEEEASLSQPMRSVLLHCLLTALRTRLQCMETEGTLPRRRSCGTDRGDQLLVSPVECPDSDLREGSSGAAGALQGRGDCGFSHSADCLPRRHMAVPPDEKDDRVIGERGDTVYPLRTKPLTGISAILFPHGASLPQRLPALDRGYDEAQEIGEESPGDPHRPAASICLNPAVPQIEGLVLCNRSSYCYANVTVYALLWHASQSEQGVWIGRQLGRFLGWLLHKPQHLHLCDTRAWPNLVRRWQQPDRQHDAAEFLQLLQWECAPAASEGSWHARIGVVLGDGSHGAQVVDRGHVWPLPLYVADPSVAHLSLQKLFIGWRNQEQRHALVNAPDSLVVQIGRDQLLEHFGGSDIMFEPDANKRPQFFFPQD
eukprot:s6056_g1.t1